MGRDIADLTVPTAICGAQRVALQQELLQVIARHELIHLGQVTVNV